MPEAIVESTLTTLLDEEPGLHLVLGAL